MIRNREMHSLQLQFCTSDRTFIANMSSQDRSHRESRNQHCTSRKWLVLIELKRVTFVRTLNYCKHLVAEPTLCEQWVTRFYRIETSFTRPVAQLLQTSRLFSINARFCTTVFASIVTLIESRLVTLRVKERTPHEQKQTRFDWIKTRFVFSFACLLQTSVRLFMNADLDILVSISSWHASPFDKQQIQLSCHQKRDMVVATFLVKSNVETPTIFWHCMSQTLTRCNSFWSN